MKRIFVLLNAINVFASGGVVLFIVATCLLVLCNILFGHGSNIVIYRVAFDKELYGTWSLTIGLGFISLSAILLTTVGFVRIFSGDPKISRLAAINLLLVPAVGVILGFGMGIVRLWDGPFSYWYDIERIVIDSRIYHLQFFAYDMTETHYHHLYECDRFDLFCTDIFSISPLKNYAKISLFVDPKTRNIGIKGDDEIIFSK
jgi:hypothetical protein